MSITINLVYLARLRETLGVAHETLTLEKETPVVSDVLEILRARDKTWAYEFGESRAVRAAINYNMATPDSILKNGDELAFFPPVTGG